MQQFRGPSQIPSHGLETGSQCRINAGVEAPYVFRTHRLRAMPEVRMALGEHLPLHRCSRPPSLCPGQGRCRSRLKHSSSAPNEPGRRVCPPSWTSIRTIVLSTPKEPDYFSANWEQGLDWYRSCFHRTDAPLLDASVSYSMARAATLQGDHPDVVPRRILELSPNARFVYMVRDPAERCYSAYWHEVRAGRESLSLRKRSTGRVITSWPVTITSRSSQFLNVFSLDRFLIVNFAEFVRDPLARRAQHAANSLG